MPYTELPDLGLGFRSDLGIQSLTVQGLGRGEGFKWTVVRDRIAG